MKKLATSLLRKLLRNFRYRIVKIPPSTDLESGLNPYSKIRLKSEQIVDIEALAEMSLTIPGMISRYSGGHLYSLCYFQQEEGDVVEVGSWQGRSASFLARAVKNSRNGRFFAIDHFRGNKGKEHYYIVGNKDLSDLKCGFVSNIDRIGLSDTVNLLDMSNEEAIKKLHNNRIRFLFVDGDHTREGVEKDIELFFPKLVNGAIVVFDDFSRVFPGLVDALDVLLERKKHSRVMTYANTLVLKYIY